MPHRRRRLEIVAAAALAALPALRADAVDASQPAILQIFESSYRNLEKRAPDIFMAGYGSVWIPPTGRAEQGNLSVGYDPYDRFDLGSAGNHTLYGTEKGLITAVDHLHKIGSNVYVDSVWNHNGFSDNDSASFVQSGGYPGFAQSAPGDSDGDYHPESWTGQYYGRIPGINVIDIAQEKNHMYIRNPVPGFANNLPAGTPSAYHGGNRVANVATEANRRFYPDLQGPSTTVNGVTYYRWNENSPSTGDPVSENATGYLMRYSRWMIEHIGIDGFRLDATKHVIDPSNGNPDWVLEYFDVAANAGTRDGYLNGTTKRVYSFGEYFDSNTAVAQLGIKKDANANRDGLDFAIHYAVKNNLTGTTSNNNWHNVVNNTQDIQDDGLANNGSQGVAFDRSHDDGGAYLSNVANAYMLMRPGNAVVYFNAEQFGQGRDFPHDGHGDALGGQYGNVLTKLVEIRNSHGRGNYQERWIDNHVLVYERWDSMVAGFSNELEPGAVGYDQRTVNTAFTPFTRLVELTGNAENPTIDPNNSIFDYVDVNGSGQITIRVPRNKAPGANGAQHNKGYVIYGPATPRGTLSVTNVDHTIAGETQTAATNGTTRITGFDVIKQNSFEVRLQTDAVSIGGLPDLEAGGDNANLKFDGGIDINGNGSVDFTSPTGSAYGFENFLTEKNPRWTGGNGLYRQVIDTTTLSEGYHYITARAYRHRDVAGTPLWSDFRKVIYVDRFAPTMNIDSVQSVSGQPTKRKLILKSPDQTASTVRFFANAGANQFTTAQLLAQPGSDPNAAGFWDRDLFDTPAFDYNNGNNVYTIVTFEPSYDPALGLAGGGVSIQRLVGQMVTTGNGAGLGDVNANGVLGTDDQTAFLSILGGASNPINPNTSFHPGADLNADGFVDEADNILMVPWLTAQGAGAGVISQATNNRLTRALVQTSGALDVPSGTLNVSGTNVPGVPLTIAAAFGIAANKTLTKTGGQTLTISGDQFHDTNTTLLTTGGTTNLNTNAGIEMGPNLAVNTSGAGSATNFNISQLLRSVSVTSGGLATLTTASANNVNGGKVINTTAVAATTGKLDLKNNNLAINYDGSTPMGANNGGTYSGIMGMLQLGADYGAWDGATGITSSSAAAMTTQTALAAAEASKVLGLSGGQTALWYGSTVDATTLLVKYTWGGDANLDGLINVDDYFQINSNYNKVPLGHYTGDFDYSGAIDGDDFFIIDANYSANLGSLPAAPAGVTSVPEPAGATVLVCALAMLARRKRRTLSPF